LLFEEYGPPRATISSAFSRSDISAGVFIPWRGGTDESGAAKFLLDLLGPPDGEVAAARRCRFLFSDYGWRWRSGGGVMVPARCELPGRIGDDPIATAPL